jgi:hypothetical protein
MMSLIWSTLPAAAASVLLSAGLKFGPSSPGLSLG